MNTIIAHAVEEIANDRTHGSRWLARRAVEALDAYAPDLPQDRREAGQRLQDAARRLAEARPAMAVIRNAVGWVYTEALEARESDLAAAVRDRVGAWLRRWDWIADDLARHAAGTVRGTIGTISYSQSVLQVLAAHRDEIGRVLVGESRPILEGHATAQELATAGIAVTLATDAALPSLLESEDIVVVGADAVLSTGAVVNKAGTFPLAAAAVRRGARCYVVTETLKITDRPFVPEEGLLSAVIGAPPAGVEVRNPTFDRTPPDLIEGYITEDGILTASALDRYVERARGYSEALGFPPGR